MRLGVDLGGSKIEIAALGPDGAELDRRRLATPQGDYDGTVTAVAGLVRAVEAELGRTGTVGIGMPGAVSPASGLIKNANSTCLIGKPLDRDLAAALDRPVRLANDANCFTLSEAVDGAGAGARVVFGVILGTGVGGGLVVDGRVLTGPNAIAGEWGHNPLPWPERHELPGPDCYCGRQGCIETFLSGPALARDHGTDGLDSRQIAAAAAAGDAAARVSLARYTRRLAKSLAGLINVIDPDVIVLGGGMSNLAELYDAVPRLWTEHVFSDRVATPLRPARHGDSSGVRGAAWLWGREAAA